MDPDEPVDPWDEDVAPKETPGQGPIAPDFDAPPYDPDIPTHDDPNSRAAAVAAKPSTGYRRHFILLTVSDNPDNYNCYDFCEGMLKELGHGGVSGMISGLVDHSMLIRTGRKPNGRGIREWTYSLSPALAGVNLDDIDWDLKLDDIADEYIPDWRGEGNEPDSTIIRAYCLTCGAEKKVEDLTSKYGKPQLMGQIKDKRLWEAKCLKCDAGKVKKKGLQAIWKER